MTDALYSSEYRLYWRAAVLAEIKAQIDKNTFKNVPVGNLPEDMNMINGTWRFTVKVDKKTGLVTRFKARFCARGDIR